MMPSSWPELRWGPSMWVLPADISQASTAAVTSAHNIVKCVNKADLEVEDIVLEQLASAETMLSPDERELGVILIDIGGGSTNIALISGHSVKHTAVLGVGGQHITNDLAYGLNTTLPEAER